MPLPKCKKCVVCGDPFITLSPTETTCPISKTPECKAIKKRAKSKTKKK